MAAVRKTASMALTRCDQANLPSNPVYTNSSSLPFGIHVPPFVQ